ncbi:tetratricopeptide repeat protein [Kitasatospora sp. NPDC059327]|uniref:tetratricopeptide repeat protein n=1 Tax=Kitasatospora sp. NPDC059327 TaxID=3346803 RepID=UPI00368EB237
MDDGSVKNTITGGFFVGTVIQSQHVELWLPPTVTPVTDGLPPAGATFVGRDRTARELHERLAPGPAGAAAGGAITVLTGLGGIGKTELALQAAHRALAEPGWFPGGVLHLNLSVHDGEHRQSPEQALDTLLRHLAVPIEHIPETLESRSALLRTVLNGYAEHGRRVLLVLDNASGADQVRPLLPSNGATPVLITSRETLTFHLGERLYDLDVLDRDAGVEFIRRVLDTARPGDGRVAAEPAEAVRLAELCAGLPLALWIATALLTEDPARPLANLRAALEDSQRRLDRLSRRGDKAVRAAFELSYRALTPQQARLFLFLSLNPGPELSTEAAARLLDEDLYDVQDLLGDLARAHLIGHGAAYERWRQHDLVRLFAQEKGNARVEQDRPLDAAGRLFEYYHRAAEAAVTVLSPGDEDSDGDSGRFADRAAALEWLETERANLVGTVKVAHTLRRPTISVHLAFVLTRYLKLRRHLDDWIEVSTTAVALCRLSGSDEATANALNNHGAALAEARRFQEALGAHQAAADLYAEAGDRRGMAEAAGNIAGVCHRSGRSDLAVRLYAEVADLYRRLGDHHGLSATLTNRATVLSSLREFDEALDDLAEAAGATEAGGPDGGRDEDAHSLVSRGRALAGKREFDEAVALFTRAAEIRRRDGDQHGEAGALTDLGSALFEAWRIDEATEANARAAELAHTLGDRHHEAITRNSLGLCLQRVGRLAEAVAAHTAAIDSFLATEDRQGTGLARINLGMALAASDRPHEAAEEHRRAAGVLRACADPHGEGIAQNHLGCALRRTGEFEQALAAHDRAVELFRQSRDRKSEGDVLNNVGVCRRAMGQHEQALASHAAATAVYREVADRHGEAEAAEKSAATLLDLDRFDEAARFGARAAEIFEETGDRYGTAVAHVNLGVALIGLDRYDEAVEASGKAVLLFRELDCGPQEDGAMQNLLYASSRRRSATPAPPTGGSGAPKSLLGRWRTRGNRRGQ